MQRTSQIPDAGAENSVHPLVRINYTIRTVAFAYCFAVIGLHGWEHGPASAAFWVLLPLQFLVYPHVAYFITARARVQRDAEVANLYVDAALMGAWVAALHFPLWIAYALFFSTALNATVVCGIAGALWTLGAFGAGAAAGLLLGRFHYDPATSPLVTALCFFGSLGYSCAVGYVVHAQNRRLAAARDAVRESENRYRLIAEHAADLIALVDQDGRWHYASPSYAKLLQPADLEPGVDAFRRVHPDDADRARVAVLRSAGTGKPRELAVRLVDREGRIRQLKMRVQAVGDADSAHAKVVLVSHDVTDLRDSEERLLLAAHALEGMTEAIMITAADGTVVTVNRAFCEISGYSRDEVLGQSEVETRNALQPPEFYDELAAIVRRDGYWSGTTWSRRKNGSVYREWRSLRAVKDAEGHVTHYVYVFYEVGGAQAQGGKLGADTQA